MGHLQGGPAAAEAHPHQEPPPEADQAVLEAEATHCTAGMAYHQMAPILSSALEACQLSKTKVSCRTA